MCEAHVPVTVLGILFHTSLPCINGKPSCSVFFPCIAHLLTVFSIATIQAKQKKRKNKG